MCMCRTSIMISSVSSQALADKEALTDDTNSDQTLT